MNIFREESYLTKNNMKLNVKDELKLCTVEFGLIPLQTIKDEIKGKNFNNNNYIIKNIENSKYLKNKLTVFENIQHKDKIYVYKISKFSNESIINFIFYSDKYIHYYLYFEKETHLKENEFKKTISFFEKENNKIVCRIINLLKLYYKIIKVKKLVNKDNYIIFIGGFDNGVFDIIYLIKNLIHY